MQRQNVEVVGEMSRIKVEIGKLSRTFLEFELQSEGIAEKAVRQVTGLVKNLQVKVIKLEARVVPSTPPEIRDQREVDVKSAVASMSAAVEQCDSLLGDNA